MPKGNCAICGNPLIYFDEAKSVVCDRCGKEDTGRSICENGHYICDACHRENGVRHIMETCKRSNERDPIKLAQDIMRNDAIYPNGPEHHTLTGAVLLTAFKNSGGNIDLDDSLEELERRSAQVPGGTCGYWGVCGAAISAGQFYSIVSAGTPLTPKPWADAARLTSNILGRLADIGGPRCCKRTSFVSIEEAARFSKEALGIEMELPDEVHCTFFDGNEQCKKMSCPYYA